ncbi:very large low complexity [Fusarium beomiforme]|uniref:ubiquitinyl hydrolase 1 n=1 Tax=Fusarium beomiforme TaxID=44412 RepID=A0A9P5AGV2_9HYPO|nr:very large low complexity [Fusarium beomiforme]
MATDETLLLEALFHHLVLPPKLPQTFDGDNIALARGLVERLQNALSMFRGIGDPKIWRTLETSLQATKDLNQNPPYLDDFHRALKNLTESDETVWLGLHVAPQNAALIIHRDHGYVYSTSSLFVILATADLTRSTGSVIFEEFQTAAPVSDVLKTEHALTWDFPSRAITVRLEDFNSQSFLKNLSQFLEQACSQAFDKFAARASKGGQSVVETRDCPSPALISEILMSLLEGLGSPVHVCRLRKRVRDDVVLGTSEIPWRRSPYWLVLRITLGRILSTMLDDVHEAMGRVYYKFIVCAVLANLLKDCVESLHPEMTLMLQAKLCRRLAKLESEKMSTTASLRAVYDEFFAASSGYFEAIVSDARARVAGMWEEHKRGVIRQIPILPFRASEKDLVLKLFNSHSFLLRLLSQNLKPARRVVSVDLSSLNEGTVSQINQLASKYSALVDCEENMAIDSSRLSSSSSEKRCEQLAMNIENFIQTVGDAYVDNSLLMSRYLLQLFELWKRMDMEATTLCPLLKDFHPVFTPNSLDVLCLQTRYEMERLSDIQQYIESRINALDGNHGTIFYDPTKISSFPARFVYSTQSGERLVVLGDQIDIVSQRSRSQKQSELANLTQQYDELTQAIQSRNCTCTRLPDGSKDVRGCTKCWKWRCRKRLKINAHEDLLPPPTQGPKKAQRATVLLQLRMPNYLSAYRSAVWKLRILGTQVSLASRGAPQLLFKDHQPLQQFSNKQSSLTLASRKKSFCQTHYQKMALPKKPSNVMFPFGAEFTYYDTLTCLWADQLPKIPWFQHLLGPWLPKGIQDPYESPEHASPNEPYRPSSYEIMANEFNCPPELSVHEFSAFQRAVSGRARRWLVLLVELGTTNFNFSSEATMKLFNRLTLQAGPAVQERGILREAHSLFKDQIFCTRLYELLKGRLDALTSSSWREVNYMNVLVTLSLRLYHMCRQELRPKAEILLVSIRSITCDWILRLRAEIRSTSEGEVARKAANFSFWAALLNRRTFWAYKKAGYTLSDEDAQSFFRASIALQESLLINLDRLDPTLKHLLIEDLSSSYDMRNLIEQWFHRHYKLLECSINETWTDSGAIGMRSYSPWKMLYGPHAWWVTSQIASTKWTSPQAIHYHLLQGHLIVDGKPLGRLPLQMRQDPAIQELFGEQHLLTRPSSLLEYQLVSEVERHEIHFGSKDGRVVIRAFHRGSLLEYVPRAVFKGATSWDLPSGLIDDCVHWLNVHTGQLEMRRKPWIWRTKKSNWILNIRDGTAIRNKGSDTRTGKQRLGTNLVEPRSEIGQKIASIFRHFEDADKLTIFQPVGRGALSVEMKRLEIHFKVNSKGLLHCPQFASEVDPQQDAGTLYGLSSQIILRNIVNPERRTVLIPIGDISWKRRGVHVDIRVVNHGLYASFTIDKVLGRLDCHPEPLLLYLKAALHALTSFPVPDGLTLRTGTEEARHCLFAARSQPWTPLKGYSHRVLSVRKSLPPRRWYYPPGMELYQKVEWDNNLTMSIQHEEFTFLVDSILFRSQQLEVFEKGATRDRNTDSQTSTPNLLSRRGRIRRQVYERVSFSSDVDNLANALKIASFRFLEKPSMDNIRSIILTTQPSYDDVFLFRQNKKARNRKRVTMDEYEKGQRDEATHLASLIVDLEEATSRLYLHQSKELNKSAKQIWTLKPAHLENPPLIQTRKAYRIPSLAEDLMIMKGDVTVSNNTRVCAIGERISREAVIEHDVWQDNEASRALLALPKSLSVLDQIIKRFSLSSETSLRKQYSQDLQMSLMALIKDRSTSSRKPKQVARAHDVWYESKMARQELHDWENNIRDSLSTQVTGFVWLDAGGLWPCLSRVALLEQLRDTNSIKLGSQMKADLVHYGILITKLQRLLRMHDATLYRNERRLTEDQGLQAHLNWRPIDHPEWLLLEIDNNLLIRPPQIDVARAIISPASGTNSVLQMNIGQGLAYVIQSRIGGLVGRVVRHLPFSRRSPMSPETINLFQVIHEDIRDTGGVMLCLPEHIMSFKLSGLQQLVDGQLKRAKRMVNIQRWLESSCRDILDESDFTLSAKTQLIYPSGTPRPVDGHPKRWLIIEELLSLIEGHVSYLASRFAGGIDILRRHQGYPILHFLRAEVEDNLTSLLIDDVCKGRLSQIQFRTPVNVDVQRDLTLILLGTDVEPSTWQQVAESLADEVFGLKSLYLLRGLISQRLLLTCLKKRWNVQYGLHPQRAPIAVPFEAKGVPSPTAEYGHPDTALILTCLAFYQSGLTKPQVVQCLQHVVRSDDPSMQYEQLVHTCKLPVHLEHWNFLNVDDETQMEDLWAHIRFNTSVVNYFLNNFALPAHAKQFGVKMQASGWDIPLMSSNGLPGNLTTGFSGTNDNKTMLPQTIKQDDLPSLLQTNAEVLGYLLEPRNQKCHQAIDDNGRHLTEKGLLELLSRKGIYILIDAGAYILEMENHDVAACWLEIYPDAQGAVYFDRNSRIMVRARFQKAPVPLLASPFADNLEHCVVYIDEAHTRGTDLKLPPYATGAVTLGLGQTKDQTVQAAMRLRQLGSTQSVAFIAPPEVHRSILDLRPDDSQSRSPVTSSDVVYWLLEQSCKTNEKMMPLHMSQGLDYCRRTNALWKYSNLSKSAEDRLQLLNAIQQREDLTLEQLYGPREFVSAEETISQLDFECLKSFATNICHQKLGQSVDCSSAFEEVELQREVEFEFEQLRENQRPVKYIPLTFPGLASALIHFVKTGYLEEGDSFVQGFEFLSKTKIGRKFGLHKSSSRLFVSKQFTKSIKSNHFVKDEDVVQRPVEWVLWSSETETAVIVIPEEAELLLPLLFSASTAVVSLLTYAAPVTKSMWRFNTLTYFTVPTPTETLPFPSWLIIEIGVLAGRLYFDFSEYVSLMTWFGADQETESPGAHLEDFAQSVSGVSGLGIDQPLKFLQEWLTYRRQTQDIMHTPMGYMCQGKKLDSQHPFFTSATSPNDADNARRGAESEVLAIRTHADMEVSDDDSEWEEAENELPLPSSEPRQEEMEADV